MQNSNYLIKLCQQIHQLGKTPSVALIRQYSDRSLTIPEIVKALQTWKNSPLQVADDTPSAKPDVKEPSLEARVAALEALVTKLTAQLDALQNSR